MEDELLAIEAWAGPMLSALGNSERRALLLDIGRELRRSQQRRIADQANPDGTPYAPRKKRVDRSKGLREKAGRIKREAMFRKLRAAKFLKVEATAEGLSVGYSGRAAYVARVHQEGLSERVARGGPQYTYPKRSLLGFTDPDRAMIVDKLLAHFAR